MKIDKWPDRDGNLVPVEKITELAIDREYCRLMKTSIAHVDGDERIEISTVWVPQAISNKGGPVYETLIFGGPETGWSRLTTDVDSARHTHLFAIQLSNGMRARDRLSA